MLCICACINCKTVQLVIYEKSVDIILFILLYCILIHFIFQFDKFLTYQPERIPDTWAEKALFFFISAEKLNLKKKLFIPLNFSQYFTLTSLLKETLPFRILFCRLYGKIEEKWSVTNGWSTWNQSNFTCLNGTEKSYSNVEIFQL